MEQLAATVEQRLCVHDLAAGELQPREQNGTGAAGDQYAVAVAAQDGSRCGRAAIAGRFGQPHPQGLAVHGGLADVGRIEGAHAARDHGGIESPVDPGFLAAQLARVGRQGIVLHHGFEAAGAQQPERLAQRLGAERAETLAQRRAGIARQDRALAHQQHGAGVQARVHLHDRDAADGVTGLYRALDGCRAAPARQHRGVHVDAAVTRDREHGGRQDQAVGCDDHHVGGESRQFLLRGGVLQRQRLEHRDAARQRACLHRRGLQAPAAAGRAVGAGIRRHEFETRRVQQRLQDDLREFRRAGEDDAQRAGRHGRAPRHQAGWRCSFSSLLRMRWRLRFER